MNHLLNICNINGAEVEPVDVVIGGSPCQDLSVAGKRAGLDGERSGLFMEQIRIIKEMRDATNGINPRYMVWENVPGAFSSNKGEDFRIVLEETAKIADETAVIPRPDKGKWTNSGAIMGDGWSIAWRVFDAQFWGVPQRRKRIYLVADFTGRRAGEILFKPDSLRGNMSQSNEAGQEAAANAVGGVDGSSGNGGQLAATVISSYGTKWNGNAGAYNGENFVLHKQDVDGSVGAVTPVLMDAYQHHGWRIGNTCGTLTTGQNNTIRGDSPLVVALQANGIDRADTAGCNGCGWRENEMYTLNTIDRPAVFSFDSLSSNSMKSSNPFSGCRAVEIAKCIDTTYPDPSKNQGGIAVVVLNDQGGSSINVEQEETSPTLRANSHQHEPIIAMATQQGGAEIAENLCPTITAAAGMSGNNQPVIALQGNGIDRADTAGCNGCGWRENEMYTLNTIDRHAVCYQEKIGALQARDYKGVGNQYVGEDKLVVECYDARGNGDGETVLFEPKSALEENWGEANVKNALRAGASKSSHAVVQETKPPRKYIIRRLTPTECARLQGFPDWWGKLPTIKDMDDKDYEFWCEVLLTKAKMEQTARWDESKECYVVWQLVKPDKAKDECFEPYWRDTGNPYKDKTNKQMVRWYNKLHTDGAEYKMWGNGIALPNAEYVIHGIAEQGAKTLGSLFDGSGGFPLAGTMNGIKPLWASEVEPYPIAVTKSRFKEVHNGK